MISLMRLIDWIKGLFNKTEIKQKANLNKPTPSKDLWLLNRLKDNEIFASEKGEKYYLGDGTYVEVLGKYSYPDVDMTKCGWICKDIKTGDLLDLHIWHTQLFKRKPHDWVKEFSTELQKQYLNDSRILSDNELYTKYYNEISKSYLRDQKLKDLGI